VASVVDICNTGLGLIGDRATLSSIDPPEGSAQGDHCARWWPIARDEALASYDWNFASTTASLALLDDSVNDHPNWPYAFALPNDCVVARELVLPNGSTIPLDSGNEAEWELAQTDANAPVLFCAYEEVSLRFTKRLTNPLRYPPKLVTALGYLMGSYLAGPVIKGKAGMQTSVGMRQYWDKFSAEAAVVDANQRRHRARHTPSSVRARGATLTRTVEEGTARRELPYWAN
jgi:hypothetical protein